MNYCQLSTSGTLSSCFSRNSLDTDRLPDVLKAESYAFVALPAEAFWDGQVNSENIKRGRLCPIRDLPKTGWIHGITLFSKVCEAWNGNEGLNSSVGHTLIILYFCPLFTEIGVDSCMDERTWDRVFEGGLAFERVDDEHWHQHTVYSGSIDGCPEERRWCMMLFWWCDIACLCFGGVDVLFLWTSSALHTLTIEYQWWCEPVGAPRTSFPCMLCKYL